MGIADAEVRMMWMLMGREMPTILISCAGTQSEPMRIPRSESGNRKNAKERLVEAPIFRIWQQSEGLVKLCFEPA